MDSPPRIFVSHSSADNSFGTRLVQDLRSILGSEESVWFDISGGLRGGAAWWRTIVEEISARSVFIVILSPDAVASQWVSDEIDVAWQQKNQKGTLIIPILLHECDVRQDLMTRQVISFLPATTYAAAFDNLLTALELPSEAVQGPPTLMIVPLTGDTQPLIVRSEKTALNIGRADDNDIILPDTTVSRHHLALMRNGTTWHVACLPHAGPLFVNGHQYDESDLRPNDQIVIGGTLIRFERANWKGIAQRGESKTPFLMVDFGRYQFSVPLRDSTLLLGRAPQSNVVIPSRIVSAHHATFYRTHSGNYLLEDANSDNGLFFQGKRTQSHELQSGDTFTAGDPRSGQFVAITYTVPDA